MACVTGPGDPSLHGTNQAWYSGVSHWLGAWHGGAVYDILAGNRVISATTLGNREGS